MKTESRSRVFISKGDPYESSLELLSTLRAKLTKSVEGKRVLIKPHTIGSDDFTTPLEVLEAMMNSLCVMNPSSVSLVSNDLERLDNLGYGDLGLEIVEIDVDNRYPITLRNTLTKGEVEFSVPSKLKDPDTFIISCSPIKTHSKHILMCAITNMLDLFTETDKILNGSDEGSIRWMHDNIAKLMSEILPDLALIDGNHSLEGNGPLDGYHISLGGSLISFDPVAADAVSAYLGGFDPYEIGYLYLLEKSGSGVADLSKIDMRGEMERQNFKRPRDYYRLIYSP